METGTAQKTDALFGIFDQSGRLKSRNALKICNFDRESNISRLQIFVTRFSLGCLPEMGEVFGETKMGRSLLKAIALCALVLVSLMPAAQALDRRVRIHNQSSYDIYYFYASHVDATTWEEDILGNDILPAGTAVVINIDDGSGYCMFDFKAVFEDGDEAVSSGNNVCELTDFYFTN